MSSPQVAVSLLLAVIVVAKVSCLPLTNLDGEHRESTALILELEEELKRQAGEDKKQSASTETNSPSQSLPQIDGLASEETKQDQKEALERLMAEQYIVKNSENPDSQDVSSRDASSSSEDPGIDTKSEENENILENDFQSADLQNVDPSEIYDEDASTDDGKEDEVDTSYNSFMIPAFRNDLPNERGDVSVPQEDMETLGESRRDYTDLFYDSLLQSMRHNSVAWNSVLQDLRQPEGPSFYQRQMDSFPGLPQQNEEQDVLEKSAVHWQDQ